MTTRRRLPKSVAEVGDPLIAAAARRIAEQAPREPERAIERLVREMARRSERTHRQLGSAVDLWSRLVPMHLVDRTRLDTIRGGTLHVVVDASATLWTLDRLLRGGVEAQIVDALSPHVRRIRLRVGMLEDPPESAR